SIYRLYMSYFVKHLDERLTNFDVVGCDEGFAFLSDKLKKAIVIGAAENGNRINFRIVQFFVVVQKAIHHVSIAFKYLFCCTADSLCAKNYYRIIHKASKV